MEVFGWFGTDLSILGSIARANFFRGFFMIFASHQKKFFILFFKPEVWIFLSNMVYFDVDFEIYTFKFARGVVFSNRTCELAGKSTIYRKVFWMGKFFFNKMKKCGGFPIGKWLICAPCVSLCAIFVRFAMGSCQIVCRNGDLVFILKGATNDSILTMFYRPFQSGAHSRHWIWRFDGAFMDFGDFELIFKFKVTR